MEDSVEAAAAERRERLRALRAAQELLQSDAHDSAAHNSDEDHANNNNNVDDDADEHGHALKFRNYLPHDKELQEGKLAAPELPKFEDPVAAATSPERTEDPFLNIAPKKPNWDLRRDVQKKLDKLEKRTQKALYKIMEEQEKQRQLEDGLTAAED